MNKYVCVHGHFYQPPRENPWLEAIEPQDSAAPYHDWNARISAECYEPNTASRILDDEDWIISITNNYSRISFNFGPTLPSTRSKFPRTPRGAAPTASSGGEAIAAVTPAGQADGTKAGAAHCARRSTSFANAR